MSELVIEYQSLGPLRPYLRNARTHSRKQIRQIADSIKNFSFTNPVLIDRDGMILAGHGRVEAARLLGMEKIPCVRLETMSEAQKRAYVNADNKLALNAGWDEEILASELQALAVLDPAFDVGITGFTIAEVDSLIEGLAVEEPASARDEELPPLEDGPAVTQEGDVWVQFTVFQQVRSSRWWQKRFRNTWRLFRAPLRATLLSGSSATRSKRSWCTLTAWLSA